MDSHKMSEINEKPIQKSPDLLSYFKCKIFLKTLVDRDRKSATKKFCVSISDHNYHLIIKQLVC